MHYTCRMADLDSCVGIHGKNLILSVENLATFLFPLLVSVIPERLLTESSLCHILKHEMLWQILRRNHAQSRIVVLSRESVLCLNQEREYLPFPRSTFTWHKLDVKHAVIFSLGSPSSPIYCFEFRMVLILRMGTLALWLCSLAGAGVAEGLAGVDDCCVVLFWWGK